MPFFEEPRPHSMKAVRRPAASSPKNGFTYSSSSAGRPLWLPVPVERMQSGWLMMDPLRV